MIPAGIALTLLFGLVVLFSSRRWAALGVMAAVCYITQGQQFTLLAFHFTAIRIVLLAGLVRLILRGEFRSLRLNKIDWTLLGYAGAVTIISWLRVGTSEELVYRLGCAYDILLSYWVFRGLLTDWIEIKEFLRGLAILILPMAVFMVVEFLTGKSVFEAFGGIGDLTVREGRARCQGAFRHGITAGVFGATLLPIFAALYFTGLGRAIAIAGLLAATVITLTSNSSGPLMAFYSGLVALFFWRWRRDMRVVRWGIVTVLVGLHLVMKAPVWYIFSKMSYFTGGDGWHRSYLIEQTIRHFSDWWLMGTSDTGDWMPTKLADGTADLTNQYVAAGVTGGLAGLVLFVAILVRCFRSLGISLRELRERSREAEILMWGIGSALLAHVVTLFSVTYFDQLHVAWWGLLAIISSATANFLGDETISDPTANIPQTLATASLAERY